MDGALLIFMFEKTVLRARITLFDSRRSRTRLEIQKQQCTYPDVARAGPCPKLGPKVCRRQGRLVGE